MPGCHPPRAEEYFGFRNSALNLVADTALAIEAVCSVLLLSYILVAGLQPLGAVLLALIGAPAAIPSCCCTA